MIDLFRAEDDARIGRISKEALEFLIAHLEEEDSEDTDYYVDHDTLEFLKEHNPPQGLIRLLESALEGRDGLEVYYRSQETP
ncbi:MAG TPA: galactosyldiacylglycerol synthase [Armatimonadetes bacterium]|nr:galactosyldiacylglycerol synthase [Armatimonadota bacterium]